MSEALRLIRAELGEDAVILETRRLRNGFMGLGAQERVEVLAGVDVEAAAASSPARPVAVPAERTAPSDALPSIAALRTENPASTPTESTSGRPSAPPVPAMTYGPTASFATDPPPLPDEELMPTQAAPEPAPQRKARPATPAPELNAAANAPDAPLPTTAPVANDRASSAVRAQRAAVSLSGLPGNLSQSELEAHLRRLLELLQPCADSPHRTIVNQFVKSGMVESQAEAILDACEPDHTSARLTAEIVRRLPIAPPLPQGAGQRLALIGPTGVGKTTTLAKLAARFALTENRTVALVTMDTYRIGAVDQLKIYARMMGIPLEITQTPVEMESAISRHEEKDVVLVDTIGRSPRRAVQLTEIREFLDIVQPTETHLVLSAPYGLNYLFEAAEQFAALNPNRLIVSKLDEMPVWGAVVSLVERTGLPLSWITDGQEVPRNLRPANAADIALQILGGFE